MGVEVKKSIHGDVVADYRDLYKGEMDQINQAIEKIASGVIENKHIFPGAHVKKRASYLKKHGKPLVGRVVGDMLTKA